MKTAPVIVVLTGSGLEVARRIRETLGEAEVHGFAGRVRNADMAFESVTDHLRELFLSRTPIIGVCSTGILIRALGSLLSNKRAEPPVIAVSETGTSVVPLLGGHRGANDLARDIAKALGVEAAITTAGDARFGVALDAPPQGWTLANPEHTKDVMAAVLNGATVCITGNAPWLQDSNLPFGDDAEIELRVTETADEGTSSRLVYHPHTLSLGVGCERGCEAEELIGLVERVLAENRLSPHAVACVVSLDLKADEEAVHALAAHLGRPARFFSAQELNGQSDRLANPSEIVMREVGCPGVAEGAALAAGGPESELRVEKIKSSRATCALALKPLPIDAQSVGRSRGKLSVVGIGPGSHEWRSGEAEALLRTASDWVGYGLYLELAADLAHGKELHRYDLGDETERCRHALELAGEGRNVALVCSGDAGIYAMASLVFELLDPGSALPGVSDAARRTEVTIAPGISALQAAAARAGAPLGHDFCAISLSDLLTPWEQIEKRLRAAAEADFVTALYNPRSMKRQQQLERAIEIFSTHRPADTPVIIASNLGRDAEEVRIVPLAELDPESVDMLTVVIIGSSMTRSIGEGAHARTYTPRGYAIKAEAS